MGYNCPVALKAKPTISQIIFAERVQPKFLLVPHRSLPDLQRMKLLLSCGRVVGTAASVCDTGLSK
jgi:hypothetical protein